MSKLALPKGVKVKKPEREPDHFSKRGIPYWWAPEWVRNLNGTICRIKPIEESRDCVRLYMVSKEGNLSYIRGSIQEEFIRWHEQNGIDYILLGVYEDKVEASDWDYEE